MTTCRGSTVPPLRRSRPPGPPVSVNSFCAVVDDVVERRLDRLDRFGCGVPFEDLIHCQLLRKERAIERRLAHKIGCWPKPKKRARGPTRTDRAAGAWSCGHAASIAARRLANIHHANIPGPPSSRSRRKAEPPRVARAGVRRGSGAHGSRDCGAGRRRLRAMGCAFPRQGACPRHQRGDLRPRHGRAAPRHHRPCGDPHSARVQRADLAISQSPRVRLARHCRQGEGE